MASEKWDGITLSEWVYEMVKQKKTESPEFKAAVALCKREHLLKLYADEKAKREGKK